ncbi:M64 family metallopeptidase [Oceanihabitans sp. 2_MG-2023]|uniref:T9SS type A sorting domain-containing protein n=1 Tax=Oceanihabitans sp. 2_MG-2023 TaxID=3062661 RepID=UPI0026E24628|nr:M64 family metallopeptidase [Oceanihabitans sp. 2_MG-2023]MDO6597832.1 M64 family metallopeptidase [Oceanihabitans sp. 2_MG-2023]
MKRLLLLILLAFNLQVAFSQTFDVVKIKDSGADNKRINLVILGDGYTSSELSQFETDATSFMNDLFAEEPFASYENYFNVHIIKVISMESGASHPGTASDEASYSVPTQTVNNYFGTMYDSYDIHRLLYTENQGSISTVLATNFPAYDQALILVNSPYYGGSGGPFPIASTGLDSGEIAIHELGHSFVDLKDEYYPGDALAAEAINMTQETDPTLVRWKNWIGVDNVGVYAYATSGNAADWNRPHQTCKMRYLGFPFCAVCKEGIIEKIHDLVSPVDSYSPTEATISNPTFPIPFLINTIQTIPSTTLENTWTLNSSTYATNVETVNVLESDLDTGTNNLTVVVHDATTQLNIDNHESIHVATISWTIDNTLGIQGVIANDFNISMYPNPSNTFVNFNIENTLGKDVLVEIISIDGKKIKALNLSNSETSQMDISALSRGLYITNFYQNNTLIASKKLVKN